MKVQEIYSFLDEIAPFKYSDGFDNTGLLVGRGEDEVCGIMLALDITNDVADEALYKNCNLIISHHPVIFSPLRAISPGHPAARLLRHSLNAIGFHTNFDMADGGISDILADILMVKNTGQVIEPIHKFPYKQLSVYAPTDKAEAVFAAMSEAGAGTFGTYDGCAFFGRGEGRFTPREGAKPAVGKVNAAQKVPETKIEMLVKPSLLNCVVQKMLAAHPYEVPAYEISDNFSRFEEVGYGRICEIEETSASELAARVKMALGCPSVKMSAGSARIKKIGISGGAGGNIWALAAGKGADAYITGEVKHSVWQEVHDANFTLIDAGHFYTEQCAFARLKEKIQKRFNVHVEVSEQHYVVEA